MYQGIVPQDIAQPLMQKGSVTADARALLQYCDQTLKRLHGREKRTEELYQQRLKTAEAHLDAKNMEIRLLKEQIEDLELLVKILEKKPGVAA
jgi:polyhydroxyalkanoate synthesis regulator phasin